MSGLAKLALLHEALERLAIWSDLALDEIAEIERLRAELSVVTEMQTVASMALAANKLDEEE